MRILNRNDIMETIGMLTDENLDVRTVTMGISLLDCIDPDGEKACEKIYNKIDPPGGQPCLHRGQHQQRVRYSHREQAHQRYAHCHAAGRRPRC